MGTLQHIILLFQQAFERLHIQVPSATLESLAIVVHKTMAADSRRFHRPEHVIMLARDAAPIQSLAALFHDIVYYQVDEAFLPEISRLLAPYIREEDGAIVLADSIAPDDACFHLTLDLFGFNAGQQLPLFGGLNECLSALVMNVILRPLVSDTLMAQLTAHVEATIPFRPANADGLAWAEVAEERLRRAAGRYELAIGDAQIVESVKSAVLFANADVQGFAEPDAGTFLDNTWKLLPESHHSLRAVELYSIQDYRRAIHSTERFLSGLNPALVFHQYRGVPSDADYQVMMEQARVNIGIATEYLGVKIVSMAILEALAEATGGKDVPLSLFVGVFQAADGPLEFGANLKPSRTFDADSPVFQLLDGGRSSEIDFDIRRSPLSAFLYQYQPAHLTQQLLRDANAMFAGDLTCGEFLARVDPEILAVIAANCAQTALTRRAQLQRYAPS